MSLTTAAGQKENAAATTNMNAAAMNNENNAVVPPSRCVILEYEQCEPAATAAAFKNKQRMGS